MFFVSICEDASSAFIFAGTDIHIVIAIFFMSLDYCLPFWVT